jgi:hypothetical protein
MALNVVTSGLDSSNKVTLCSRVMRLRVLTSLQFESKNYARARGLTGLLNSGNGIGGNVFNDRNVLNGPNATYGLNNGFNGANGTNGLSGNNGTANLVCYSLPCSEL